MDRDELQENIAKEFCSLEKRKALAVLGTSFGKTKLAFLIIETLKPKKVLFLVESTVNRDVTIKDEMKKWGMTKYLKRTEFATYQLAYKWKRATKDLSDYLVICDECDYAFTQGYGRFFIEYKDVDTFAMTGYVTPEKYRLFKGLLPLLVSIPVAELQKEEVLNKTVFKIIQYPLSRAKSRKKVYLSNGTEKSFFLSENEDYKYIMNQQDMATKEMLKAIASNDFAAVDKAVKTVEDYIPRKRANLLHSLDSSIRFTRILINKIREHYPEGKIITFSERTASADRISTDSYHGKTQKGIADQRFKDFQEGKITLLSTCSKVNRGVNIPNLKYAIMESFTSSITQMMQKNGRMCRLSSSDVAVIYLLVPYYWVDDSTVRPTQAVHWARKIIKSFPENELEVLNYCGEGIEIKKE